MLYTPLSRDESLIVSQWIDVKNWANELNLTVVADYDGFKVYWDNENFFGFETLAEVEAFLDGIQAERTRTKNDPQD